MRTGPIAILLFAVIAHGAWRPSDARSETEPAAVWQYLGRGQQVLMLAHGATEPARDESNRVSLGDCASQRPLSAAGRRQALRFGEALRQRRVRVDRILSSNYCRTVETAELLGLGAAMSSALLDPPSSLGDEPLDQRRLQMRLQHLRELVADWRGPGNLLLVTHPQIIGALARARADEGEMLVLMPTQDGFSLLARLQAE